MSIKFVRPHLTPDQLQTFFNKESLTGEPSSRVRKSAAAVLWYLNAGLVRVVEPKTFATNVWVKRAILAYFSTSKAHALNSGCFEYFDKLPVKRRASLKDVRVVPGAVVRFGSFIAPGAILMPSFVNVGAFVDEGSMIDTWATVGSCAYVGKGVHVAGGVGIGGVLEPAQASPVIIEDGAFLGSRCVVVEGVRVGRDAVLGAGVVLTASTKIIDVRGASAVTLTGAIPDRAVVIPGTQQKIFDAGQFGVPCALLIGERKESTDKKTSLNAALREFNVAV